jgi:hypothetical protein
MKQVERAVILLLSFSVFLLLLSKEQRRKEARQSRFEDNKFAHGFEERHKQFAREVRLEKNAA